MEFTCVIKAVKLTERTKNIMLMILEQVALAFLVVTFCSCVLSNGMSLDDHFRRGLGVTIVGLAYLAGHAAYITAMKLPGTVAPAAVEAAANSSAKESDAAETEGSATPTTTTSMGKDWGIFRILATPAKIIRTSARSDRPALVLGLTNGGDTTASSVIVNSGSYESGGFTVVPSGTITEGGDAAGAISFAVAAGAGASGGPTVVWDTTYPYQANRGPSWNNQRSRHLGPGPRMLTEAQMKNAISLLKTKTRQDVLIVTMTGKGDAPMVADQLTEAFSRAGWDVFVETSETRSINGVDVGEGIHFVGQNTDHESVQIAWNALKDTPVIPASIVPVPWKTLALGSERPQLGPPLTIVIGTPLQN